MFDWNLHQHSNEAIGSLFELMHTRDWGAFLSFAQQVIPQPDLLCATLEGIVDVERQMPEGLVGKYPAVLGDEGLITPACAFAATFLDLGLKPEDPLSFKPWLANQNIATQLLLLSQKQWAALDLKLSDIDEPLLEQMKPFLLNHSDLYAHRDDLHPLLPAQYAEKVCGNDIELILSQPETARCHLLTASPERILSSLELKHYSHLEIDLDTLPMPLGTEQAIIDYWDQARIGVWLSETDKTQADERIARFARIALNATALNIIVKSDFGFKALEHINHPARQDAINALLDAAPDVMSRAPKWVLASKLASDILL